VLLHPPRATRAVLIATWVWFALAWIAGGRDNPLVAIAFGANSRMFVAAGELWRLIVSMFVHANFLHLAVNSVALYSLGRNVEAFYGPWRFLLLYLASGLAGSVASAALTESVSVGASGGVFGLLGASIVFAFRFRRVLPPRVVKVMGVWLVPFLILNVGLGFVVPRIDVSAHFGGLAGGALVAAFLLPDTLRAVLGKGDRDDAAWIPAVCIGLLAVSFAGAGAYVWKTRGPDGPMLESWKYDALARMEREMLEREITGVEGRELLMVRAQLRIQRGDWAGAIEDYRTLLEAGPEDAAVMNNLAWALLEEAPDSLRDAAEAARLAERALELEPGDPYVLGTAGTAKLRAGDPAAAAELLRRALRGGRGRPGEETDRYLLAIALARSGQPEEARKTLRLARERDGSNPYRGEAEAALAGATQSDAAP
jgi:rhomboid protease GluP